MGPPTAGTSSAAAVPASFTFEPFNAATSKFDRWLERLEISFRIFKVQDNDRRDYLLHYMGAATYDILCSKLKTEAAETKSYKQIGDLLKRHFNPEPLEILENFKFSRRNQHDQESLSDFLTDLEKLAQTCNFGDHLDTALRNQFVFGLSNRVIQSRLLEVRDLTLAKAKDIAFGMEMSQRGTNEMKGLVPTSAVQQIEHGKRKFKKSNVPRQPVSPTTSKDKPSASLEGGAKCYRCGDSKHFANTCKYQSTKCRACGKKGHLAKVCQSSKQSSSRTKTDAHHIEETVLVKDILHLRSTLGFADKFLLDLLVNGRKLTFELDTGSPVSLISARDKRCYFKDVTLQPTDTKLDGIGKIVGVQASLNIRPDSSAVYMKARPVAFAVRDAIDREIDRLVADGVWEKVERSEWATPVVPVLKTGGRVRLCGDYKITINPCLLVDDHPLPTVEELFASVAGGEKFSKLDLSQAYLQLEVRPEDRELLTLSTHRGLFRPTRLMYGVASAPAVFQRLMEQILQGIPGVTVFIDDVRISGPDDKTHLLRLGEVLQRIEKHVLATDASPYGVGAVLSHQFPDGTERPLQYASQTLTQTQQRYSQVDKEAYAIIFGIPREYVNANKWEFGRIMQRLGKLHYLVELDDGRKWKRHIDQLRSVGSGVQSSSTNEFFDRGENVDDNVAITTHASKNDLYDIPDLDNNVAHPGQFSSSAAEPVTDPGEHTESKRLVFPAGASAGEGLRRSVRTIKPPQRLDL
ncbi:uncharacterized protein LOC129742525 [Uranotaenia lowii]|uniref:uncharacterized protein LOC129742525 n=1 Tax=Uranotaenia lowii TaxID=190385 RepID=UPI0024793937|nr:uncharacterized protein LOC129742525 [Uranotaenia lowii]